MNEKRNIRLMYAVAALQGMVFYAPVATLYRQAQGVSLFEIALIESVSLALMIVLEIPWGMVTDRIGYKKTLVACNVLYFVSKLVFWKASGFLWFLCERLLLSVVLAGLSGCDTAYLFVLGKGQNSHRLFGLYSAMSTAGVLFASAVFSLLIKDDYPLGGLLTAASYGVSMLLSLALQDVRPEEAPRAGVLERVRETACALRQQARFLLFLFAAALLIQTGQTITVFFSQPQYIRSGILPEHMGYLHILVTIAGLFSAKTGALTRRMGESAATKLLFLLAGAACAVGALSETPLPSVASILLIRLCSSLFEPIHMARQNLQVSSGGRAAMLSAYSSMMNIAAIFTNLLFGRASEIHIGYAFALGTVFCLFGFALYAVWEKRAKSRPRKSDKPL
ncbi:MAG TPA: MFS transporter [Feifaniaceae bacterium]|nr:MFS transporter [Feifaniaceae bacterium]